MKGPAERIVEGRFRSAGTIHYNIQLTGGALWNRVTARYFEGVKPEQIEWVWMVEAKRHTTADEIKKLCAVTKT